MLVRCRRAFEDVDLVKESHLPRWFGWADCVEDVGGLMVASEMVISE